MAGESIAHSYTLPSDNPGKRTRIFADGRNPDEEWQCDTCMTWYPSNKMSKLNLRSNTCSCLHCFPPPEGSYLDRLWKGQAYMLSWNNSARTKAQESDK
jgi:hypothetical protein